MSRELSQRLHEWRREYFQAYHKEPGNYGKDIEDVPFEKLSPHTRAELLYMAQEIERLLAQEREPMECGHPKACWYESTALTPPSGCQWCLTLRLFEDTLRQEVAVEREKVREMCAAVAKDFEDEWEPGNDISVKYLEDKYGTLNAEQAIRQLDLTKLDEGKQ